ncbi:MAG TPA: radical SAM protein, partial [bacterium]|nr:radical SAM protein [bacterium]
MILKETKHLFGLYASELRPLNIMVEITNKCNFNCIHCYIDRKKNLCIDSKKFEEILVSLQKLGCFKITFTGGEPLTHPEFDKIISLTEQYQFIFSIFTNGHLLTEKIIKRLRLSKYFGGFHISFYGVSSAIHDKITGIQGSFDKLMSNIESLKKNGIKFILKTAIMKHNYREWEDIMIFCSENNYKHAMEFTFLPREDKS